MEFNPIKAQQTLSQTAKEFVELQRQLEQVRGRKEYTHAFLLDEEHEARRKIFEAEVSLPVTQQRDWIKYEVHEAQKAYDLAASKLAGLKEQIELKVEILNALKASLRLQDMEVKNLNLTN